MLQLSGLGLSPALMANAIQASSVLVPTVVAQQPAPVQIYQPVPMAPAATITAGATTATPVAPGLYMCPDGSATSDPTLASCPTTIAGIDLSTLFWVALLLGGGYFMIKRLRRQKASAAPALAPAA